MAKNGKVDELTARQKKFVLALLTSASVAAACRAAGIGNRTGHRYLTQAKVRRALSLVLDGALSHATARATGAMAEALETLEKIHKNVTEPPSSRVAAARALLLAGPKLRDAGELAERLAELEAILARRGLL